MMGKFFPTTGSKQQNLTPFKSYTFTDGEPGTRAGTGTDGEE